MKVCQANLVAVLINLSKEDAAEIFIDGALSASGVTDKYLQSSQLIVIVRSVVAVMNL